MIPILYDYSDTSWTSNGRGRLSDCISCTVTEERNGIYECEFEYPITGAHYAEIQEGRVIGVIHDDTKTMEPFDIYARSAEIDGVVTFYAHHISYRLLNIIVNPFTASSVSEVMGELTSESINQNPFSFMTDKTAAGNFTITTPKSIREMLCGSQGSILDVYGTGEYEFTRFDVKLWLHRGQDTGVEIRYGKNMVDLEKSTDASGTYNAVAPYWYSPEEGLIALPEKIVISDTLINTGSEPWTNENGTIITDENLANIEFNYATITIIPMDMTTEFEDVPTVDQLRDKAKAKLENSSAWLPNENIKVDFVALWQTEEYKDVAPLQRVSLCDTVNVYFPQLGVNAVKAKVIRTVYNVLLECYDEMELGDPRYSFAEAVSNSTIERVSSTMASKSFLAAALDQATKLLAGGLGGYVVMNANADGQPQEILVMDTDDITSAVNVIRINKNGIGFSQNGYNGPFSTAWTIDGHFVADFIDSGSLNASLITSGTLNADRIRAGVIASASGGNSWDMVSGLLKSVDSKGRSTEIRAGRISFKKGTLQTGRIVPTAWGNDFDTQEGVAYLADVDAAYLGIGRRLNNGGTTYAVSDIVINNGLNPYGVTERVILDAVTRARGLLPLYDYTESVCNLGASDSRYYQVWTSSLNFATGAYITYYVTNDYIYSSKTINQASDERLKDIKPYNDKYDDIIDVLEPIIYTWKDHPDGAEYVGLGARKTAALLDGFGLENSGFVGIGEDDKGEEVYGIDYNELSVMLLHKVQKQQEEINTLKAQLDAVLKRLERLEGKNADS